MRLLALTGALLLSTAACSPKPAHEAKAPVTAPAAAPPVESATPSKMKEISSPGAHRDAATPFRSDTADIVLAPKGDPSKGDQVEYMIAMKAGDTVTYSWAAPGAGDFWHEFHGHTADAVTFYKKAAGNAHQGVLVAPFDGSHGWYFENRTSKQIIVRVETAGFYKLEEKK